MRGLLSTGLLTLGTFAATAAPLALLSDLQWEHRVVLVWSSDGGEAQALQQATTGIDDRDIAWFVMDDEAMASNYPGDMAPGFVADMRNAFNDSDARVLLIGKDGGVKASYLQLDVDELFERIDAMPMRKAERQYRY